MEILIGMLGAVICIGIFILGFFFGRETVKPKTVDLTEPTPDELVQIQEERQRLIDDQKAFRELMNYNANIAYSVKPTGE